MTSPLASVAEIRVGDIVTLRGYRRRATVVAHFTANNRERTALVKLNRELTGWRRTSTTWELFDVRLAERAP